MNVSDISGQRGEVLVTTCGAVAFPAVLDPVGPTPWVLPRFRREVAELVVEWVAEGHLADPQAPDACWDDDVVVVTRFGSAGGGVPSRVEPDRDGRYSIGGGVWRWQVVEPADDGPRLAGAPRDLLDYATQFTFDGNPAGATDRRFHHPNLVIHVVRVRRNQWRVERDGMAYNRHSHTWEIERAARTAESQRWAQFHTSRDEAVLCALMLIEVIRPDVVADRLARLITPTDVTATEAALRRYAEDTPGAPAAERVAALIMARLLATQTHMNQVFAGLPEVDFGELLAAVEAMRLGLVRATAGGANARITQALARLAGCHPHSPLTERVSTYLRHAAAAAAGQAGA